MDSGLIYFLMQNFPLCPISEAPEIVLKQNHWSLQTLLRDFSLERSAFWFNQRLFESLVAWNRQWFCKSDPRSRSISITWELVSKSKYVSLHHQTYQIRNPTGVWTKPLCVWTKPSSEFWLLMHAAFWEWLLLVCSYLSGFQPKLMEDTC